LGLAAALILGACGPADDEPGPTTPTPSTIEVLPTEQSSCKQESKNDTQDPAMAVGGKVEVVVTGSAVEIIHEDAYYNCASRLDMKVKVTGAQIEVHEVILNPGELARCMCHYDLSTTIKGLAAGAHTVSVYDADGKLVATVTAVVGASAPPSCRDLDEKQCSGRPDCDWHPCKVACVPGGPCPACCFPKNPDPCEPMDAQATGLCKMLITSYKWDGQQCVMLGGGCTCTGADCGKLYKTQEECEKAYAGCLPPACPGCDVLCKWNGSGVPQVPPGCPLLKCGCASSQPCPGCADLCIWNDHGLPLPPVPPSCPSLKCGC
jgi:hypothetical protein